MPPPVIGGKAILKTPQGFVSVPPERAEALARENGWSVPTQQEAEARAAARQLEQEQGTAGRQAQAAAETAIDVATFGLVDRFSGTEAEAQARRDILEYRSPGASFAAQAAGSVLPGLAAASGVGAAGAALGLAGRAAGAATLAAEGLGSGLADEAYQARREGREISAGNVFLFGLGGEIVGRAIPRAFTGAASKLKLGASKLEARYAGQAAAEKAAGEAKSAAKRDLVEQAKEAARADEDAALRAVERNTLERQTSEALNLPAGPERQELLVRTEQQQLQREAKELARAVDESNEIFKAAGDRSSSPKAVEVLRRSIAPQNAAQIHFVTDLTKRLRSFVGDADAGVAAAAPPTTPALPAGFRPEWDIRGKSLSDLGAIDDPESFRAASLKGLRESDEFRRTGRVPQSFDSRAHAEGVRFNLGDDGELYLADGRHRLKVAQESGSESVWGRIVSDEGEVYRGPIPLKQATEAAPEPVLTGVAAYANEPYLKGAARNIKQRVSRLLDKLDAEDTNYKQVLIMRDIKQELQAQSKAIARARNADNVIQAAFRREVNDEMQRLLDGLEDRATWGRAADAEARFNSAWHTWFRGNLQVESKLHTATELFNWEDGRKLLRVDPDKARSVLSGDDVSRQLFRESLDKQLRAYEDMADAAGQYGVETPADVDKLRKNAQKIRQAMELADEISESKVAVAHRKEGERTIAEARKAGEKRVSDAEREAKSLGPDAPPPSGDGVGAEVAEAAAEAVLGPIPFAGMLYRKASRLVNVDAAAKARVAGVARSIAGTAQKAGRAAERSRVFTRTATTALARFGEGYHTPQDAYGARVEILEDAARDPVSAVEAIVGSMQSLAESDPGAVDALTTRTLAAIQYVTQNIPAGIAITLQYPNGTPPSRDALREFAVLWNTVFDPMTVMDDIEARTATPAQIRHLKAVHPDLAEGLYLALIEEMSADPGATSANSKIFTRNLLGDDGLMGPGYGAAVGMYVSQSNMARAQQMQGSRGQGIETEGAAPKAAGISAIQGSVTNAGGR